MILIKELPKKLLLLCVVFFVYSTVTFSQDTIYNRSFESAQKEDKQNIFRADRGFYRSPLNVNYFYTIKEDGDAYRLINKKEQDVFNETYDAIFKNAHFIKTVQGDLVSIYRLLTLEKIKIPNLIQAYFMRDGLEVLTFEGAQYYDNSLSKIDSFPELELFKCGTVYSKRYSLKYDKSTKKHTIKLSKGHFGGLDEEIILDFIGLPEGVESMSFLSGDNYTSVSVNNDYEVYPNIIKIVKDGKSGLYSYNIEEAIYPKKKKKKNTNFVISKVTGDTIFAPLEPFFLNKKGLVRVKEVLPITFDKIHQSSINGLVYLYKDEKKGIYPQHTQADFNSFNEKTFSFYSINRNGKWGWIDLRTHKEYYFE